MLEMPVLETPRLVIRPFCMEDLEVVHRLLDEADPAVTLSTISRAATALKRTVTLRLPA